MWLVNTKYFNVKGRLAHHKLKLSNFQLTPNSSGVISLKYFPPFDIYSCPSKESAKLKKSNYPTVIAGTNNLKKYLVNCYSIYLKKRPKECDSFYLTPKSTFLISEVWYNKVPMGKNSIGKIMNDIIEKRPPQWVYTIL